MLRAFLPQDIMLVLAQLGAVRVLTSIRRNFVGVPGHRHTYICLIFALVLLCARKHSFLAIYTINQNWKHRFFPEGFPIAPIFGKTDMGVGSSVTFGERVVVVMRPWSGETDREVE